jgi:branched-subunit amino acid aminotransferase/4-amino-4-deoxychorismate lyase
MTIHSPFCCINGEFVPQDALKFNIQNRAFRYGDAVFETFRCFGNQPFMFDLHYDRLMKALQSVEMDTLHFPQLEILEKKVESLINKNRYFGSSRVRLTVFRNDGGYYTPDTNACSYLLEALPIDEPSFSLNTKGMIAGVYTGFAKQPSIISPYKTGNSMLFVLAGNYKKANSLSEVLLVNTEGLVVEALASNLFWFIGSNLYTPMVSSGCVDGIMRQMVLKVAAMHGIKTIEVPGISIDGLKEVDELFVTNSVQGIKWIVGIGENRYFNIKTRQLFNAFLQTIS